MQFPPCNALSENRLEGKHKAQDDVHCGGGTARAAPTHTTVQKRPKTKIETLKKRGVEKWDPTHLLGEEKEGREREGV